jgi:hypothetical protein
LGLVFPHIHLRPQPFGRLTRSTKVTRPAVITIFFGTEAITSITPNERPRG